MQAAAGTRGAMPYYSYYLDIDMEYTEALNETAQDQLPPRDPGMSISYASFNLRDQVRTADSSSIPLQFAYEAADCRLYFTLDNALNMTRLWHDVAEAAWDDSSLCVAGSTGYSTTGNKTASNQPPQSTATQVSLPTFGDPQEVSGAASVEDTSSDKPPSNSLFDPEPCPPSEICPYYNTACGWAQTECTGSTSTVGDPTRLCLQTCRNAADCGSIARCSNGNNTPKKVRGGVKWLTSAVTGFCIPNQGTTKTGCTTTPIV